MNETSRYWLRGTGMMKAAAIALAVTLSPLDMAGAATSDKVSAEDGSVFGQYLAGRFARSVGDTTSASRYYELVLKRGPDNADILREAIQRYQDDGFEGPYGRLCDRAKLNKFKFDDIADELVEPSGETDSESDAEKPSPQKRPARILDYEKDPPSNAESPGSESPGSESDKDTQSDTSGTDKSALAEQNSGKKKSGKKKSGMTQKEVGDKAEQAVQRELENQGWDVENMNEKHGRKNFPGFDLLAKKDNIEMRVEVKGKEHGWSLKDKSSVTMSFQQMLHCAKTVDDAGGGETPQYWLYIAAKLSEDYGNKPVDITPIELSREKPDIRFNSSTWSKR